MSTRLGLQVACLLLVMLAVTEWIRDDPSVRTLLVSALIAALAAATVIGLLQSVWTPPFLQPIDPDLGVSNPSVMGYKNPMALAVLGQIYLALGLAVASSKRWGARGRWLLLAIVVAELVYLVALRSRASYMALAVTFPLAVAILGWRWLRHRRGVAAAAAAVTCAAIVAGIVTLPEVRSRLGTLGTLASSGRDILGSDRATYALNTLVMVRDRPFGVGLGNWQVYYPVYRASGREVGFDPTTQVRRAHSDPMQVLGELGWQGLALWLVLTGAAVYTACRSRDGNNDQLSVFIALQIVALAVAGVFDYVQDLPFGKLETFCLFALAAASAPQRRLPGNPAGDRVQGASRERVRGHAPRVCAVLLSALAAIGVIAGGELFVRSTVSGELRSLHARGQLAGASSRTLTGDQRLALERIEALGTRFAHLGGHDKTFHRDWLLLAHAAWLGEDPQEAWRRAHEALELHPYDPTAFTLLAKVVESRRPGLAETYRATAAYIMDRARTGFLAPYPVVPEELPGG